MLASHDVTGTVLVFPEAVICSVVNLFRMKGPLDISLSQRIGIARYPTKTTSIYVMKLRIDLC